MQISHLYFAPKSGVLAAVAVSLELLEVFCTTCIEKCYRKGVKEVF